MRFRSAGQPGAAEGCKAVKGMARKHLLAQFFQQIPSCPATRCRLRRARARASRASSADGLLPWSRPGLPDTRVVPPGRARDVLRFIPSRRKPNTRSIARHGTCSVPVLTRSRAISTAFRGARKRSHQTGLNEAPFSSAFHKEGASSTASAQGRTGFLLRRRTFFCRVGAANTWQISKLAERCLR
jgi:hypothetical protein